MIRIIFVSAISAPIILYYLWMVFYIVHHQEKYTEEKRYTYARKMVSILQRRGRIKTLVFGHENLPKDSGYAMYSNHQGKYDALGIVSAHKNPCTILIDEKRSKLFLTNEFIQLLNGSRLDKTDPRKQVKTIRKVTNEIIEGRRYIIFPEGGYDKNKNIVQDFLPGAFKCAIKSKTPIVPVALIDSYKVFGINSIKKVTTQVHFLNPIYYEEYKDLSTIEIAEIVKTRIMHAIAEHSKQNI